MLKCANTQHLRGHKRGVISPRSHSRQPVNAADNNESGEKRCKKKEKNGENKNQIKLQPAKVGRAKGRAARSRALSLSLLLSLSLSRSSFVTRSLPAVVCPAVSVSLSLCLCGTHPAYQIAAPMCCRKLLLLIVAAVCLSITWPGPRATISAASAIFNCSQCVSI